MAGKVAAPLALHSTSIASQVFLLLTDAELWAVAPSHAYGLIAITGVDVVAFPVVYRSPRSGLRVLAVWAALKLALFLGDVLTAPEFGMTYAEFAAYLFGLPAYVVSVAVQPPLIVLSVIGSRVVRNS